jgi:uncharacterized Zn finger protein (UPF0148 family)
MTTQVLKSAVAMVCNMLERDNTPVRHEAAQELRAALATVSDASPSPSVQPSDERINGLPIYAYDVTTKSGYSQIAYAAWFHKYGNPFKESSTYEPLVRLADVHTLSTQSAQPVSEQAARFAIEGAISYGRMGVNKPPSDDHWLMPFWLIGGECAKAAQPAQPVAFNAAWDGIDWDVWRMRSIKELVQHLHTLTAPDVRPSEMELRNEIAELKSYLDMVAPEDGFTDAVVLSINQAQRIQETVFILSNMVDSTQPHGESSRQRVAEAAKALCKKQPVPSQPASVPVSDESRETLMRAVEGAIARSEEIGEDEWYNAKELQLVSSYRISLADAEYIAALTPVIAFGLLSQPASAQGVVDTCPQCGLIDWRDFYAGNKKTHNICATCGEKREVSQSVPGVSNEEMLRREIHNLKRHIEDYCQPAAAVQEPKLVLALPIYEKRSIVIASEEIIDGERIVCVAIKDAAPAPSQPQEAGQAAPMHQEEVEVIASHSGTLSRYLSRAMSVGTMLYTAPAQPAQAAPAVPEGWRERLEEMDAASYTFSQYPDLAHAIFDSVINALDELERAAPSAPLVSADPLQALADQAQELDMGYGPNACPTCGKSAPLVSADSPGNACGQSKETDLSKRLREIVADKGADALSFLRHQMLLAADEIERYYGGMLAWKATAEAKDRATTTSASASAIDLARLPEPLLAFDSWLNEPPSREVHEPNEVRNYRYEAYHRWQDALTAAIAAQSKEGGAT